MSIFKRRPAEDVETERARMMARVDVRGHEMTVERIQKDAERRQRADERKQKRADRAEAWAALAKSATVFGASVRQKLTLILPLLFVNGFAVVGQAGWAEDNLNWQILAAAGFAATLESIALYVGYHAHAALMAGDSATKLKVASYSIGAVIGGINYDHYAGKDGGPTAMAVIFGLLSLISPWLWAMHGRYKNRRRLEQLGLIDERAPHFSAAKWLHFPFQTFGALRFGVAHNMKDPAAAWEGYQRERSAAKAAARSEKERKRLAKDKRSVVRVNVVRVQTVKVPERKERVKLFWVPDLSALTIQPSGSESVPVTETQTGPAGRSENGSGDRSQTQTSSRSQTHDETRSGNRSEGGSRDQVSASDQTHPETSDPNRSETGPKKRPRRRSKTGPKAKVSDRLAEAKAADKAYLADHGRHIPAEKLARALGIGKPAALDLVKQVRGGHIDVAK